MGIRKKTTACIVLTTVALHLWSEDAARAVPTAVDLAVFIGMFLCLLIMMRKARSLTKENDIMHRLMDASRMIGIIATDQRGVITFFNTGSERMLGYASPDVIGKMTPLAFHVKAELEGRSRELSEELGGDITGMEVLTARARKIGHDEREWTLVRKDGSAFPSYLTVTTVLDKKGSTIGLMGVFLDITEPKRIERALSDSEASLKRKNEVFNVLLDNLASGVFMVEAPSGRPIVANRAALRFLGRGILPDASRDNLAEVYKAHRPGSSEPYPVEEMPIIRGMYGEEAHVEDMIVVRPSGEETWLEVSGTPIRDASGQVYASLVSFQDITERKRSERMMNLRMMLIDYAATHTLREVLQKSLDEVSDLLGSAIGFYHFVDELRQSLTLQAWSTRTLREFCHTEGHGMHYSIDKAGVWVDCVRERRAVVHNDYASMTGKKGLPPGHAPVTRELVVPVIKDDRIVAILGVGNKASDYTDEDVRTVTFLADVTWEIVSRKITEESLRESEAKLSALFASMSEMVVLHEIVLDDAGVPVNYRIVDCNAAFTLITGIKIEDAKDKLATEVYGTSEPPYLAEFARVVMTGESYQYETYFAPMDKHFSVSVVCPGEGRFATITTDISESKRIQAIIDAKNKELEQIVYVASHDLRSPLVNVDGYSRELEYSIKEINGALADGLTVEELKRTVSSQFDDMGSSIDRIRQSASQMDKLLKGLLSLSRHGRSTIQFEDIDMNERVSQLIETFSFTFRELGAEVSVGDLPPCRGDPVQITQVFSNLITNAIKYRDDSRPLRIRVTGAGERDRSVYRVEDNGIGIAANHLEHVFELFHRLDPDKGEGDGIGLTIARQALSRMYGDIRAESTLGEGSVFIVSMPPARVAPRRARETT